LTLAAPPDSPQRLSHVLTRAISTADLSRAAECFARDACFLTPDSTAIRGREEIRAILGQLIARQSQIEVLSRSVLIGGGAALLTEHWALRSAGPDGSAFQQRLAPRMVARWVEGRWKLAVVAPWGSGEAG
jgi:uncharacterized protein (TIGR02246 family)